MHKSHDCKCGAAQYEASTYAQATFLHNTTVTHTMALYDETGAPEALKQALLEKAQACEVCGVLANGAHCKAVR